MANLPNVVRRFLKNEESPRDRQVLLDQILDGSVVFTRGDSDASVGGKFKGNLISGSNNQIVIVASDAVAHRMNKKIFVPLKGVPPPPPTIPFIGRRNDIADITRHLQVKASQPVMIYGWPGAGKTSLASALARHKDIANLFPDGVLWLSLGQKPDMHQLVSTWTRALGASRGLSGLSQSDLFSELQKRLRSARMLLIVDDVWDTRDLIPFLNVRTEECGILVTTRLPKIAEGLTSSVVTQHRLKILTEDDALLLLWSLIPDVVEKQPDACRDLMRDLERLPLAIHVAGRLLRAESKLGWGVTDLIEELRSGSKINEEDAPEDRIEGRIIPTVAALLRRSTDLLDVETRHCFACLGMYCSKPASFDLKALASIWQEKDPRPHVRQLVDHGLLEPTGNGRFQLHALLVAHAKSLLTSKNDAYSAAAR